MSRPTNVGLFIKLIDSEIPTPWVAGKTWWLDCTSMSLKVWDGTQWLAITAEGGGPAASGIYVMAGTIRGLPTASALYLIHPVTENVTIPAGGGSSKGFALTVATTAKSFSLQKNGVEFGTMNFAIGLTTATFTIASAVSLSKATPDLVTVVAPSVADSTLANIGFALHGTR